MTIKAQRVSKKSDNKTWCRPSKGYDTDNAIEIELNAYEAIDTVEGELPKNDKKWPLGAPMSGYVKVEGEILKKKTVLKP